MSNVHELDKALQLREAGYVDRAAGIIKTLRERSTHPRDVVSLAVMEAGCYREMENFEQAQTLLSQARAVATNDDLVNLSIQHETARLERAQGKR